MHSRVFRNLYIHTMRQTSIFTLLFAIAFASISSFAQSNQYLHLDGEDDFVMTENAAQYVAGAEGVSMTGWYYTDALVYGQGMIGVRGGGDGAGQMYIIQLSDGLLECRYISSTGFNEAIGPAGSIVAQEWQHIAWVYNGSTIELFINGVSVASSSASGEVVSVNRPFAIGKSIESGFNFVFGGRVDEITLWSRGITQAEILDMMANELVGTEEGLELYYKMDQGAPGGNNVSITELICEIGNGERNASFENFALSGETSNFNGVLEDGVQVISFPQISNKLISDAPFELEATANSGLPVSYSIVSGPATLTGSTVTLDGTVGQVIIQASQSGDATYDPATDVDVIFEVLDPDEILADIDLRNPVEGDFYATSLSPILLSSIVDVAFPELFSISSIVFDVDGTEVPHTDYSNTHQTGWWTPSDFGEHTFTVTATHSGGASHSESHIFNIVNSVPSQSAAAFTTVWADADNYSVEVEGVLPSYQSSFDQIQGMLEIDCPPGGCDPWDRVSSIDAQGHNGEWYQIIRYLTPYGVACEHEIDLTDFMSLLQGKVRFRVNLGTQGNGFLYTLNLNYTSGTPTHGYSTVEKLWNNTYAFGDLANLTPTLDRIANYPTNVLASTLKVVSSGHGWGDNNTGNAAEFHHDIHHFWVNGVETFEQDNWYDCNPNPDDCSPQNGTWFYDRAGWCPGSIAQFFDYDMTPYVGGSEVNIQYVFDEDYVDFCHPNNPDCVSGVTCPDCGAGFNPHLIVQSYLISMGNEPLDETGITVGLDELETVNSFNFAVYPNPCAGKFSLDLSELSQSGEVTILDINGRLLQRQTTAAGQKTIAIDLGDIEHGIYLVRIETREGIGVMKVVVE